MAGNIKGITIKLNGDTTNLQKALKSVSETTRKVNSELGKINKSLKFNPGNTELLAQKHRQLSKQIENTSAKLKQLKQADSDAKKQLEAGNLGQDDYDALQREIIETESKLKHFQTELNKVNNHKLDKLGNQFTKVGDKLKGVGTKLKGWGTTLSARVTAPLAGIGAVSFKSAADLEDAFGATDQIFKDASGSMKKWADSIPSYYGIAESEALGYANTMGAMLQNIGGLSEQEAAKQSQTLTQLAGDLSAMFGGTTESAVQALTGALKGNTSMLDNYGMGVNDATIKAKALEMGLYDGKGAMDLQSKQAATLALIMEQTGDAQGQAAREAEGASGSMKSFTTEIKNLATDIGQQLLPIFTPMIQKLTEWVNKFKEMSPETQQMIVKIGLIAAAIGPLLIMFGQMSIGLGAISSAIGGAITSISTLAQGTGALGTAFQFIGANLLPIVAGIGLVVAAFVTLWNTNEGFRTAIITIWNNIKTAASELVTGIQERLSGLQLAFQNIINFITPIWTAFANMLAPVFVGAFTIIQVTFETVKNVVLGILDVFIGIFTGNWSQAWEGVKTIFSGVWEGIKGIVTTVFATIQGVITGALNVIKTVITSAWNLIKTLTASVWEGIKIVITGVWNVIKSIITTAINIIKTIITTAWNVIKTVTSTVWNGIKTAITTVVNVIKTVITTVWNTIKTVTSTVWNGIKSVITTVWNGIKTGVSNAINAVKTTITTVFNTVKNTVSNIWNGIKSTISGVWEGIKSGVSSAVDSVSSVISNVFGTVQRTVTTIWNGIKSAIETPINAAKGIVEGAINTIKGLFNFKFEWPKLPMPHFSIKGSMNPLKWIKEGTPKLSVDWYAQGGVFDQGAQVIGVGERGPEAVMPTHKLDKFLEEAVKRVSPQQEGSMGGITINIESMNVRDDSDVKKVADEVMRLIDLKMNRNRLSGGLA